VASKPQPATRIRTCRACGKKFEYPIKGSPATRFHCEVCATLSGHVRLVAERLSLRIAALESRLDSTEKRQAIS
jgi:hypothetical protein